MKRRVQLFFSAGDFSRTVFDVLRVTVPGQSGRVAFGTAG